MVITMNHLRAIVWLIPIVLLAGAADRDALAKPPTAPVRVEYEVPENVKTGDSVTTVLTFRAQADLDRLEVTLAPFMGLELTSEPKTATFTGVKKGEGRQLSATIRLTDPKFGSLAVTYTTVQGRKRGADAITVVYGNPGN